MASPNIAFPLLTAQANAKNEQQKINKLEFEVEQLKQQNIAKTKQEQTTSPLVIWLISIASLLLIALVGMLVLALRRSRQAKENEWWDPSAKQKKNVVDMVDLLHTSAEKGDLDPSQIIESHSKVNTITGSQDGSTKTKEIEQEFSKKYPKNDLPALEDTNSSTFNFFTHQGQSIHIEEISDLTQEAEFWMSVNDPQRAIEILEPQSLDENQTTPVTWLFLLDLYRIAGNEEKYNALRKRFKRHFNARIPEFHEDVNVGTGKNLEDLPHLITKCCLLWNTDQEIPYLESLLVDAREGDRLGFDLPIYRDILMLISICHELQRMNTLTSTPPVYSSMPKEATNILGQPKNETDSYPMNDYSNSLNFDMLDLKLDGKDKK